MLQMAQWIRTAPKSIVLRTNTLLTDSETVLTELKKVLTTAKVNKKKFFFNIFHKHYFIIVWMCISAELTKSA